MDEPLGMTLRELFFVVGVATNCLNQEKKEQVLQWLCNEMERRVSEESLREVMQENGYTKEERCVNCNEIVSDWNFEENGDHILCEECQEQCKVCKFAVHSCKCGR